MPFLLVAILKLSVPRIEHCCISLVGGAQNDAKEMLLHSQQMMMIELIDGFTALNCGTRMDFQFETFNSLSLKTLNDSQISFLEIKLLFISVV